MNTINDTQHGVVKRMREIRDELSKKTMNMTSEELKIFFKEAVTKRYPNFYDEIDKRNNIN